MKTFLCYLTFAALLTLCYVERNSATEDKTRARAQAARRGSRGGTVWISQNRPLAKLRQ
ncbi:hypothetical protein [Dyadobacter beijingensis]|nr:hypothetical protein [Dyadobacter beijingensis]